MSNWFVGAAHWFGGPLVTDLNDGRLWGVIGCWIAIGLVLTAVLGSDRIGRWIIYGYLFASSATLITIEVTWMSWSTWPS